MGITKAQNLPAILTSLDFRKAFDSPEWPFLMKTLYYLNFETEIKRWVSTFHSNIQEAISAIGRTGLNRLKEHVRAALPLLTSIFFQKTACK